MFVAMAAISFASCGNNDKAAQNADTNTVDTNTVDTNTVDTNLTSPTVFCAMTLGFPSF